MPPVSVAATTNEYGVPVFAVGVPEITPVEVLSDSPPGRAPEAIAYVIAESASDADRLSV